MKQQELKDLWEYVSEWKERFGRFPKDSDELCECISFVMKKRGVLTDIEMRDLLRMEYEKGRYDAFTELKKKDDEKIWKEIRDFICWTVDNGCITKYQCERSNVWLVWLEKQGSLKNIIDRCKDSWYNEGKIVGMAEGLTDDEKYQQGWHDALEKQGEQKPEEIVNLHNYLYGDQDTNIIQHDFAPKSAVEAIKEEKVDNRNYVKPADKVKPKFNIGDIIRFKGNETLKGEAKTHRIVSYDNELYVFADGTTDLFCEQDLYELVEQNPADKVEPIFHEGDWIIGSNNVFKIVSLNDKLNCYIAITLNNEEVKIPYYFDDGQGHMCSYHLFTIQDVKDGDVICYKDEISLYKHVIKNCTKQETTFGGFVYHCCYDGKRFIIDSLYFLTEQDKMDIHPANKKQCDLLFAKIKEAGYKWDAEKKELKKIEQKITWSDNDIDIFIEKACEFWKDHLAGYDICEDDIERSIESFKLGMTL